MTPHHVKVVQLTEDYAKLTRDDRSSASGGRFAPEPVVVSARPEKQEKKEKSAAPEKPAATAQQPVTVEAAAAMLLKLDEKVVFELLEMQLITSSVDNDELQRAIRRVFKLAREGDRSRKGAVKRSTSRGTRARASASRREARERSA